jgi:hypothetical protein
MKIAFLALTLILSLNISAQEQNVWALKGGPNLGFFGVETLDDMEDLGVEETTDNFFAPGIHSSFGYRWDRFELLTTSTISISHVRGLSFYANEQVIRMTEKARYNSLSISPQLRYHLPFQPITGWRLFVGAGPVWSLQTLKLKNFQTSGNFSKDQKLTYESFGSSIVIGLEEVVKFKKMHPVYWQLTITNMESKKVWIVDVKDPKESNILIKEESKQEIEDVHIVLSLGLTFF